MKIINITILLIFPIIISLELKLSDYTIFKDGMKNSLFDYQNINIGDCKYNQIFSEYGSDSNKTTILVLKNNSENFIPISVYINNNNTHPYFDYKENETMGVLEIYHECYTSFSDKSKLDYIFTEKNSNLWTLIRFQFLYNNNTLEVNPNNETYHIDFVKFCKEESKVKSMFSGMIIILLAIIMTYFASKTNIKFDIVNEIRQHNEIKWWHGLVFLVLGSCVLILIFYLVKYIASIFTVIAIFQCMASCFATIAFYNKRLIQNEKFYFLKHTLHRKIYDIKLYKIISFIISLVIIYYWYTTRHWILNNFLAYCLCFLILSIFAIKDFKVSAIILICLFVYDVFWVFFSQKIFDQNVMVVAATSMNIPNKLEIPLFFSTDPIRSCTFLGLGDIVLPGMIIKYCKRFDKIKGNNKLSYFKFCMGLYIISIVLAYLMVVFFNHAQPVLFYICPIFIVGLTTKAFFKGEIKDFMQGKNLIDTTKAVDEIINGEFTKLDEIKSSEQDSSYTEIQDETIKNSDKN